ncbi:MAG: HAD-IIA family hydrolase, partial [Candidatus Aenigmatarchaeota archaeon]
MSRELALIDMDGTVYTGNSPIDGVNQALELLDEKGVEKFFLTNYAGTKRESYSRKLEEMGIDASSEDVVTSGWLTSKYIRQNFPDAEVFVLGEEDLKDELRNQDIAVVESCSEPEILVVSNKHDLTYEDLKEVLQGVADDTKVFGTNPDETIPGDDGEIPGAGTIIEAVETMTGKDAEI